MIVHPCRRAFDDDVRVFAQPSKRHDRDCTRKTSHGRFRARHASCRHCSESEAVDPLIEPSRDGFANGAKPTDRDVNFLTAGHGYCGNPSTIYARVVAER